MEKFSKPIEEIIVHCSDSTWGDADEIKKWHTNPKKYGGPYDDIGYHRVICNGRRFSVGHYEPLLDGLLEVGRIRTYRAVQGSNQPHPCMFLYMNASSPNF